MISRKAPPRIATFNDQFWQLMLELTELTGCFSINDICESRSDYSRPTVWSFIRGCLRHGFVEQVGRGRAGTSSRFRVVRPQKSTPVIAKLGKDGLKGQRRLQLWTAMRTLPSFSVRELAFAAATEEAHITINTAACYVTILHTAGVLQRIDGAVPPTYRLRPSANTGPLCPMIIDSRIVFDRNLNTVVGVVESRKAAA